MEDISGSQPKDVPEDVKKKMQNCAEPALVMQSDLT